MYCCQAVVSVLSSVGAFEEAIELPIQFRYEIPSPERRVSINQVCGGVVIQRSDPEIITGGYLMPFTIEGVCQSELKTILDLHRLEDRILVFSGYWNDVYEFIFYKLDNVKTKGRNHSVSGSFLITCEIDEPNPSNSPYCQTPYGT